MGELGQRMIDIGSRVIDNEGIMNAMDGIIGFLIIAFMDKAIHGNKEAHVQGGIQDFVHLYGKIEGIY